MKSMTYTVKYVDLPLILACIALILTSFVLIGGYFIFRRYKQIIAVAGSIGGEKSVETHAIKKMEKAVAGDILAKYPELQMLLEQLSPETAELVKKNPQLAVTLIQRYQPIIEKYIPMLTGQDKAKKTTEYDL